MEITSNEKDIVNLYKDFSKTADELATIDVSKYPLRKNETKRDRYERHLIGMIEMYVSRFCNDDDFDDSDTPDEDSNINLN